MINSFDLRGATERLRVYDVDQGGWELEGEDFEVNAKHVLFHLVKDMTAKDFSDRGVVIGQIAPDSLQYALRLMRWTGRDSEEIVPNMDTIDMIDNLRGRKDLRPLSRAQVAFMKGAGAIARYLHDKDHENDLVIRDSQDLMNKRILVAREAGKLLACTAESQSGYYAFDLFEAFDDRLANLRGRFGIPAPEAAT